MRSHYLDRLRALRESKVVAAGSEKAAAHRLGPSHSTVKHHLASARSKVGASTRAIVLWLILGFARPPLQRGPRALALGALVALVVVLIATVALGTTVAMSQSA